MQALDYSGERVTFIHGTRIDSSEAHIFPYPAFRSTELICSHDLTFSPELTLASLAILPSLL